MRRNHISVTVDTNYQIVTYMQLCFMAFAAKGFTELDNALHAKDTESVDCV